MAGCIAIARGIDSSRIKEVHRLGSEVAFTCAATWRTFANAEVWKDGRGYVEVIRDGAMIHRFRFGPEGGQNDSDVRDSAPE